MPIAHCFIANRSVTTEDTNLLATRWAGEIQVDVKDICITLIPNFVQGGMTYGALVNLYLPSLWSAKDIGKIQQSLHSLLASHFGLKSHEIFIMTSIVQSGHVVENGRVVEW